MGRAATMLVLVGVGACAATAVVAREMAVGPRGGALISDSPKEVMDQAWQIVFRDYLDTNGKYTSDKWRQLRRSVLAKSYATPKEAYEAIRGMLGVRVPAALRHRHHDPARAGRGRPTRRRRPGLRVPRGLELAG